MRVSEKGGMPRAPWICWFLVMVLLGMLRCLTPALAADVDRRTLNLKMGGSELVETKYPFKRVTIANPKIADIVVLSPREFYIYAKKVGYTSLILWQNDDGKTRLDVVVNEGAVNLDLNGLKEMLHRLYPDQQIEVYGSKTGIVLAGTVSGPEIVEQVVRLAEQHLPSKTRTYAGEGKEEEVTTDAAEETTQTEGKVVVNVESDRNEKNSTSKGRNLRVTNLLKVRGIQQVMLEVKFAEVSRTSDKNMRASLGIGKLDHFTGAIGVDNVLSSLTIKSGPGMAMLPSGLIGTLVDGTLDGLAQAPNSLLLNFAGSVPNVFINIDNVSMALELLEKEGLARVLAEPKLVTQSGHEARFLAGGEFPIQVVNGIGLDRTITVIYKEFGVALVFTPVVLSDGKISLHVAPSVSDITGFVGTEVVVPNFATRKLETTVELFDGQSLALAGLLRDDIRENVNKVPGLGDIPILGSLFRSTSYTQEKTDLLVAVTPHLVKPVPAGSIKVPGESIRQPDWFEFYLEGRLEGRHPAANGNQAQGATAGEAGPGTVARARDEGGLEGDFGHQPVQGTNQ